MKKKIRSLKSSNGAVPKPATKMQLGVFGWNAPLFNQTHHLFIESFKNAVELRGGAASFFGLSGSADFFSLPASQDGKGASLELDGPFFSAANYWLSTRDLIADQIEMVVHGERLNGLAMVPWSIDSLVGMLMAAARLNLPALFVPNYLRWAPALKNAHASYSRASMILLLEVLGLTRIGSLEKILKEQENLESAEVVVDEEFVKWGAQKIAEMVEQEVFPRRFFSPSGFANCVVVDCALGASTETFLHLAAIAQEAGIPFTLAQVNRLAKTVPMAVPLNSQGEFMIHDLAKFGGLVALLGVVAQFLEPSPTVSGKNISDLAKSASSMKSSFKLNQAAKKVESLAVLNGNLAREGALFRTASVKEEFLNGAGPVKVFNSEKSCSEAIMAKKIKKGDIVVLRYCGPKGSPGMPALTYLMSALQARGLEEGVAVITDGRVPASGKSPMIVHVAPEAAQGSALSILQDGDVVQWNLLERTLTARLTETEVRVRLSRWKEQEQPRKKSFLSRYSKHCCSSAYGATLV